MDNDLTSPEGTDIALRREEAMEAARRYAYHSHSESTWWTYESAWHFPSVVPHGDIVCNAERT